ncbi:MAG: MarR family transcriptional regulator [Gammaproteobacteria bacterium]|nr:MarR family transcriptional regulator [Gammaproteobacteria bacterium]MBT5203212.1 MarR family transcriptional regulator [Gammaproteobacteria bacterium]MBT5603425.1 MarR family transcriptional regulator [Gammaproteobacteria bacterium]MBT6244108.1 MarR family transcriptional regulator [Gammaproteobacteria bacterium]
MNRNQSIQVTERELAFLLVDAGRKLNDAYDLHMKPLKLSRARWRVMAYVSRMPGISQTELSESIECSRMAISSLLDRMQAAGLIERRHVQNDRRVRAVFLTDNGAHLVRKMNQLAAGVLDEVFAGTSTTELEQLRSLLNTIKTNAARIEKK